MLSIKNVKDEISAYLKDVECNHPEFYVMENLGESCMFYLVNEHGFNDKSIKKIQDVYDYCDEVPRNVRGDHRDLEHCQAQGLKPFP